MYKLQVSLWHINCTMYVYNCVYIYNLPYKQSLPSPAFLPFNRQGAHHQFSQRGPRDDLHLAQPESIQRFIYSDMMWYLMYPWMTVIYIEYDHQIMNLFPCHIFQLQRSPKAAATAMNSSSGRSDYALWIITYYISHRIHVWYIYAHIGGILMVNVTIYGIHGSYGYRERDRWL